MRLIHSAPRSTKAIPLFAFVLAMCTFAIAANAQSKSVGSFKIPYEVTWNNSVLPAGEYTIKLDSLYDTVIVRSTEGGRSILIHTPAASDSLKGGTSLIVTHYGDRYIVSSLNLPSMGVSFAFKPNSKREREALAKAGKVENVSVAVADK